MTSTRKRRLKIFVKSLLWRAGLDVRLRNPWLENGLVVSPDLQTVLSWYLTTTETRPFFIQIGANDGYSDDPLYPVIRDFQLPGLLVEPQPALHEALTRTYRDMPELECVHAAIADRDDTLVFYSFSNELTEENTGFNFSALGALEREQAIAGFRQMAPQYGVKGRAEDYLVTRHVPAMRLETLLSAYDIAHFDILVIDAEGYDLKILYQLDLHLYRPILIYYEHAKLDETQRIESWRHLRAHGYTPCICGSNTLALKTGILNEHSSGE